MTLSSSPRARSNRLATSRASRAASSRIVLKPSRVRASSASKCTPPRLRLVASGVRTSRAASWPTQRGRAWTSCRRPSMAPHVHLGRATSAAGCAQRRGRSRWRTAIPSVRAAMSGARPSPPGLCLHIVTVRVAQYSDGQTPDIPSTMSARRVRRAVVISWSEAATSTSPIGRPPARLARLYRHSTRAVSGGAIIVAHGAAPRRRRPAGAPRCGHRSMASVRRRHPGGRGAPSR